MARRPSAATKRPLRPKATSETEIVETTATTTPEPVEPPVADQGADDTVADDTATTTETPDAGEGTTTPVVTAEPTTKAPDGAEAVVTIDGQATQPNSDGTDGGTGPLVSDAATTLDQTPTVTPSDPAADDTDPDSEYLDKVTDDDIEGSEFRRYWTDLLESTGVQPPKGRILFPGEPITFSGQVIKKDHIILTEDVYRMVLPFRSRRPTFTLEARAGKRVQRARVITKAEYLTQVNDLFDGLQ